MKTVEESHVLKNVGETFFKMITNNEGGDNVRSALSSLNSPEQP